MVDNSEDKGGLTGSAAPRASRIKESARPATQPMRPTSPPPGPSSGSDAAKAPSRDQSKS